MSSRLIRHLQAEALVAVALIATATPLPATAASGTGSAAGKFGIEFRYRLEHVDVDGFAEDALAATLRTRINFTSGEWQGFSAFAEGDYVTEVGPDDYNAGAGNSPGKTGFPVVADPHGTDLNQAWLQWQQKGGLKARAGRQRIIYDNARFVGNVGWRQNEQTYDGLYLQHPVGESGIFQLAWVDQVNRIFGNDVPAGKNNNNTWLANLGWQLPGVGKISGYYYAVDNRDVSSFSTATAGLRLAGSRKLGSADLGYLLEYARQTDAHNNPVDFSARYFRLEASAEVGGLTLLAGLESLGGDSRQSGASFRTPLATLHAFNGWADTFLSTPDAGLVDVFGGIKGQISSWKWDVYYHDFGAESGPGRFGQELDASLSRAFAERYTVLFKVAWFDARRESVYADTYKWWVQLTAGF